MPNSADKSTRNTSLSEDSDVIELTDEMRSKIEASSVFGSDDALDFAMPEFKLPELSDFEDEDEGQNEFSRQEATQRLAIPDETTNLHQHQALPDDVDEDDDDLEIEQTAILKPAPQPQAARQTTEEIDISTEGIQVEAQAPRVDYSQRPLHKTMQIDLNDLNSLEEISYEEFDPKLQETSDLDFDALPAFGQPAEQATTEPTAYDREEMVKTIQMQAVDRDAIERQIDQERLKAATPVQDQRFAPDVLASPPRVLTKRWQEWPLEQSTPEREPAQQPPPSLKGQIQQPQRQPHQSGPHPSFQNTRPATGPAPSLQRPQAKISGPHTPNLQGQAAAPPQAAISAAKAPSTGDAELDGLVQELLDESSKKEQAKAKAQTKPRAGQPGRDTWFKEVFNEEYFRSIPPEFERQTDRELQFISQSLGLEQGARLLDLACGYGRHSVGLSQQQVEVVGLDLSMDMLQRALANAQRRSLSIKFIHADMRSLNFNEVFDSCLLWQSSFGYFDDITNFKVLQGIWRALKPGGRLLLDVLNRDHAVAQMPSRCWWEGQGCIFLEEVDFEHAQSVLHTKRSFIYEDGSPPLEQNMYVRLYSLHEIANLVTNAGFRVLEVSGELHHRGRFLGPCSSKLVVLAEKVLPPQKKA